MCVEAQGVERRCGAALFDVEDDRLFLFDDGRFRFVGGPLGLIPGKPEESELFELITYQKDPVMPPRDKAKTGIAKDNQLPANDIAIIRQWIEEGAPEFPRSKKE